LLDEFTAVLGVAGRESGRVTKDVEWGFVLHPAGTGDMRGGKRKGRKASVVERWHSEEKRRGNQSRDGAVDGLWMLNRRKEQPKVSEPIPT
jgi:hypothetical protein